jgi:glycosyltransferase involved in cell wall biosynthesis
MIDINYLISVIIPILNTSNYLEKCIDSVINQSYKNLQIILINDGSSDRSEEICLQYLKKDSRISYYYQKNQGQSSARNKGIFLAKGSLIGFVDSDDWIDKDMFLKLLNNLLYFNADISSCNFYRYFKNNNYKLNFETNRCTNIFFNKDQAIKELLKNEKLTYSPVNKLYKKSLFNDLKFLENRIYEDLTISYQLIHKTNRIIYTSAPLYHYRFNPSSTLRKEFSVKKLDEYKAKKDMHSFYSTFYPKYKMTVYFELFFTSYRLYCQIKKHTHFDLVNYKYLLDFDKKVILKFVLYKKTSFLRKLVLILFLINAKIIPFVYEYI